MAEDRAKRTDSRHLTSAPSHLPASPAHLNHLLVPLPQATRQILRRMGSRARSMGYSLFLVGGCLRDLLLGRPVKDLDLLVEGDAIRLALSLEPGAITHPRFKTASFPLPDGGRMDLASARSETYERPAALPVVEHASVREDLRRRDFSINAMAISLPSGALLDPFCGMEDLEQGSLRVLHDGSFLEDPTRLLRAVRLEWRLGFQMEGHTEALARKAIADGALAGLSGRRLRREMEAILSQAHPLPALERMQGLGLLAAIHPALRLEGPAMREVREALTWFSQAFPGEAISTWMVHLMALAGPSCPHLRTRLALRRGEMKMAEGLAGNWDLPQRLSLPGLRPSQAFEEMEGLGVEVLVVLMGRAKEEAKARLRLYLERLRFCKPSLTGRDLLALGYPRGPQVGRALRALREARMDGQVLDRCDEWELAARLLQDWDGAKEGVG